MKRLTSTLLVLILSASVFSLDGAFNSVVAPGDLDITFSGDGKLTDTFPTGFARGYAVAIQPDGKIVMAGERAAGPQSDFGIMRFNEDGSPDATFGTAGKVVTSVVSGLSGARAVAIQPNGKIVAAGVATSGSPNYMFALVRYDSNGALDTTFGTGGIVVTPGGLGTSVALQPDGKIVVSGYTQNLPEADFMTARYNTDGSLDNSFSGDGIVTTSLGPGQDLSLAVAVQPDGKILAAGNGSNGQRTDFAAVRYNADGTLDLSFGSDGKVITNVGTFSNGRALALQSDGRIIIGGNSFIPSRHFFAMVRLNTDGSRDASFGSNGEVVTAVGLFEDAIFGLALQSDGRIVAAGYSSPSLNEDIFAIVRYETNGSVDLTYGINGIRTVSFGGADIAFGVALDTSGRAVVGGTSIGRFALARLLSDGTAPTSNVSVSGRVVTANGNGITKVRVTLTDPNGQSRTAITGGFGYYQFDDVPINLIAPYTVSVSAKRYSFTMPSRTINVQSNVTDVDFVSVE